MIPMRLSARFFTISWRDLAVAVGPIVLLTVLVTWAAYHFVRPAPPDTITITTGAEGSMFRTTAERYRAILARNGVRLQILPSEGSLQNLQRLNDSSFKVDLGFVQGGLADSMQVEKLVSLGSVFHEPLAVFYRSAAPVRLLSAFGGKRVAIGPEGSGGRALALVLLKANGIEPGGATKLLNQAGSEAAAALINRTLDAAFLTGDSASPPIMRQLLSTPGVRLFNFVQADAYARRFPYLDKLELPMGSFDLGRNNPREISYLIGPTVELVAREGLHPALSDLLIEAAREVHGGAGLLRRAGEFPAPLEHEFRISDDASRYYKSGKGFLYRNLPFWLATLTDRLLVIIVPILVLLIPGLRLMPWLYTWRVRSRIYRWYGDLIALERSARAGAAPQERDKMLKRLDDVEIAVNKMKMPLAFANEFYVLREHIGFVRARLAGGAAG
jgi:TRAP-type uncharacterized transport system substrate-binding protein